MLGQALSCFQVALAKRGAATTFAAPGQRHLEPGRFEDSHRCDADLRLMIAGEGVIPEDHSSAVRRWRSRRAPEPGIKALARIMRQRALPRDPHHFGEQT